MFLWIKSFGLVLLRATEKPLGLLSHEWQRWLCYRTRNSNGSPVVLIPKPMFGKTIQPENFCTTVVQVISISITTVRLSPVASNNYNYALLFPSSLKRTLLIQQETFTSHIVYVVGANYWKPENVVHIDLNRYRRKLPEIVGVSESWSEENENLASQARFNCFVSFSPPLLFHNEVNYFI